MVDVDYLGLTLSYIILFFSYWNKTTCNPISSLVFVQLAPCSSFSIAGSSFETTFSKSHSVTDSHAGIKENLRQCFHYKMLMSVDFPVELLVKDLFL